jgi:hypothetical protein
MNHPYQKKSNDDSESTQQQFIQKFNEKEINLEGKKNV